MKWNLIDNWKRRILNTTFAIRLLNWEYWPTQVFYYPLIPHFIFLAIRARTPCFFTAANTGIEGGGMGFESKFTTIQKIPRRFRPRSIVVRSHHPFQQILDLLATEGIGFPLIAKPEIGFRGMLVEKIAEPEQLKDYLRKFTIPLILQEFLDYSEEVGVLYYRFPNQESGQISSLTLKEFLYVTGDGQSSVRELIEAKPRAKLQLERLKKNHFNLLEKIPGKGKLVKLGEIGNHSKGTRFINGNHLIDDQLLRTIDRISRQIPGFNYGRFDIKCNSLTALKKGEDFKIIELNGVFSEPTHIYDPNGLTYFGAVQTLARHWSIVQQLGTTQHQLGVSYWPVLKMIRALWQFRKYALDVKRQKEGS